MPVFVYILIFKTPLGLRIRTVGESPNAASSVGLNVNRIKFITLAIGGAVTKEAYQMGKSVGILSCLFMTACVFSTTPVCGAEAVEVEAKAYAAHELLKADLEENDGIYTELDSARRSVAEQQDIMDRFTEKYGADYAAKTVAQPGYSEHHTGLALDLYFRVKDEDGVFTDVYYNEDMEKEEYKGTWDTIHEKLADYGFILRYLEGEEHITGYRYEPWHIRYLDNADIAKEIMSRPGLTLEEYLAGASAPKVSIDLDGSEIYTEEELHDAMLAIKCQFASWKGCELHSVRYAGDDQNNDENLAWLNSLDEGADYIQVAEFLMDYHTAADIEGAWEQDFEYRDYQWWLARPADGDWQIVTYGY